MAYALVAWSVSAICALVVWLHARKLSELELPSLAQLIERVRERSGADASTTELASELDDLLIDVDRETSARPELASALGRVTLASGTALALLALANHPSISELTNAGSAFAGGVVGASLSAYFGRLASARARHAREHWSELARLIRKRWSRVSAQTPTLPDPA